MDPFTAFALVTGVSTGINYLTNRRASSQSTQAIQDSSREAIAAEERMFAAGSAQQMQMFQQGQAQQMGMFREGMQATAPWRDTGQEALRALGDIYGIRVPTAYGYSDISPEPDTVPTPLGTVDGMGDVGIATYGGTPRDILMAPPGAITDRSQPPAPPGGTAQDLIATQQQAPPEFITQQGYTGTPGRGGSATSEQAPNPAYAQWQQQGSGAGGDKGQPSYTNQGQPTYTNGMRDPIYEYLDGGAQPLEGDYIPADRGPMAPTEWQEPDADRALSRFQESPGYRYQLAEANKSVERAAAATGGMGGSAYKRLQEIAQQGANMEWGNFTRGLQSMAGVGQTAATQYAGAATNVGSNLMQGAMNVGGNAMQGAMGLGQSMGANIRGAGSAEAQGYIQQANAFSNMFSQGLQAYGFYQGMQPASPQVPYIPGNTAVPSGRTPLVSTA